LHGKIGGVFTSTASQHGGIETTAFTALTFFSHQGITFVPLGYAKTPQLNNLTEVHGCTPYGAGTIAGGDGSRQPSV
jgi:NAD(P)H dehydrogenase (quinone)